MNNNPTLIAIDLQKAIDSLIKDVTETEFTNTTLLKSKLALSLTLINMSIKSIPRLINLFEFSQKAEEKIFNQDAVTTCTDISDLVELYKLSTERQMSTISFISSVLNSLKWNDLENILLIITSQTKNNTEMIHTSKTAQDILQQINELKQSGYIKEKVSESV